MAGGSWEPVRKLSAPPKSRSARGMMSQGRWRSLEQWRSANRPEMWGVIIPGLQAEAMQWPCLADAAGMLNLTKSSYVPASTYCIPVSMIGKFRLSNSSIPDTLLRMLGITQRYDKLIAMESGFPAPGPLPQKRRDDALMKALTPAIGKPRGIGTLSALLGIIVLAELANR